MSYSLDEGIEDHERMLRALKAVKERFPDATLRNGKWYAGGVAKVATDLVADGDGLQVAAKVGGMYVFDSWGYTDLTTALYKLKMDDPAAYVRLLDVCR